MEYFSVKKALRIKNWVQSHQLLCILLAAVFTMIVLTALTALINLPWLVEETSKIMTVTEQNGVYDLAGIIKSDAPIIRLAPGNTYYPNTYLLPENVSATIPESTSRFEEIRALYLSQRFIVMLPDNSDTYTLSFKLSGRHAMRVYVNGRLAAQAGHPGTVKQDTEVWDNSITFNASSVNGKMDIILHSAQFYHAKKGASLAVLNLSKQGVGMEPFASDRIKGLLVMGALLSAAILLLGLYLMLARTKATLYFALACFTMALRECVQSQAWTYFPIPGNISFMLEYLSMVLLTVFLSLYLGQYALNKFLKGILYAALIGSGIYGMCVLFSDSVFYTSILKYYQLLLILCIIPGISGLFWKLRHPIKEQIAALYGIAVFYLSAVADLVMYLDIFDDLKASLPVSELAMLIFAMAQAFSLYLMNNRVLAEAKEAEQRLVLEKAALENLDRMKTEFLGNVSHELKTPLTVMSGYAQYSQKTLSGMPEMFEVESSMKLISSEADRLALMVTQILDATRIEEGRMMIDLRPASITAIIQRTANTYYPVFSKNNNSLRIKGSSDVPNVLCDESRISQVLVNLISNAARHTCDGVITISAEAGDSAAIVTVADTGEGIAPERLPYLFERFKSWEKEKARTGKETGTGLGLYICKHIIESHGGEITVSSTPGEGTTFSFTIPFETEP